MDILIGLLVVALLLLAVYVATHHKAPATPAAADLANTVAAAAASSLDAFKRDLPEIISAELARAKLDLSAALQEAQGLRDRLAATVAAHAADKAAVAARVAAAVTASPELPPSPVVPAVALAQAEDLAAVRAATAQISG